MEEKLPRSMCPVCKRLEYEKTLKEMLFQCPECGSKFRMVAETTVYNKNGEIERQTKKEIPIEDTYPIKQFLEDYDWELNIFYDGETIFVDGTLESHFITLYGEDLFEKLMACIEDNINEGDEIDFCHSFEDFFKNDNT